jgi:hypothetical protein
MRRPTRSDIITYLPIRTSPRPGYFHNWVEIPILPYVGPGDEIPAEWVRPGNQDIVIYLCTASLASDLVRAAVLLQIEIIREISRIR